MAKKNDLFLVVDLEATCWDGQPPGDQQSEIIEVGICPINIKTAEVGEKESILIKPQHSQVSKFCTELTTITPDMLEQDGITYQEAVQLLKKKYQTHNRPWGSWGAYDRKMFDRMSKLFKIGNPMSPRHISIKTFHAVALSLDKECGMPTGLKNMGYNLDGTHHRGDDDAYNIARIFATHLKDIRK